VSAAAPLGVPADCDSTRALHFRTLLGSGTSVVGGAIAAAALFALGASQHSVALMAGGPVAVVLVVVALCWYYADRQAENEFFERFAAAHQMSHAPRWQLYELTPLLGGGDRRKCEHWMEARGQGIGWYTFEVKHEHDDKDTWTSYDFTLATVDLGELGMRRFQGIYLRRRRGVFDRLNSDANWLAGRHLKKVELESTEFCEKFELWAEPDQDDIVLRQLFTPKFVIWLAEHPLEPGFELHAGTLAVFVPGHCGEAGKLEWLLMSAREIAKRIQLELTEAAQAGSL
jgi:hypothetical protein